MIKNVIKKNLSKLIFFIILALIVFYLVTNSLIFLIGVVEAVIVFIFFQLKKRLTTSPYVIQNVDSKSRWQAKVFIFFGCLVALFFSYLVSRPSYDFNQDMDEEHQTEASVLLGISLFCLTGLIFIVQYKPPPKKESSDDKHDHGSAEWATVEEFIRVNQSSSNDKNNELWIGGRFGRTKPGHFCTFAPPGSGKGTCLIIPNLLVTPAGSYVVTDPKGENACITARAQVYLGQKVFILDPWDEQTRINAKHGISPSCFNPFDFLKGDLEELPDNCEMIAHYLVPVNHKSKEPFWDDRARSLIKILLVHIVTSCKPEEHNFWTLYKYLRNNDDSLAELILSMEENKSYDGLVSAASKELTGLIKASSTFAGIVSNAQNATKIFESPKLRKSMEKSDFNPYNLSEGNSTVYIVIPERYLVSHSAWLRMVIGLCLKAVNAKPKNRVNFIIDEFAVLGKMEDILKAYAYGRGQNIVMWTFMQSIAQLKEIYGEDGMNNLINSSAVFQAFGLQDQFSKEYVSKMLGNTTRIKTAVSTNSNYNGGSTSESYQTFDFPLLTPEEVGKERDIITIIEGVKFRTLRLPYFRNKYEMYHSTELTKEQQEMISKGEWPKDEIQEGFLDLADKPPRLYV